MKWCVMAGIELTRKHWWQIIYKWMIREGLVLDICVEQEEEKELLAMGRMVLFACEFLFVAVIGIIEEDVRWGGSRTLSHHFGT